jgi:hypothetical protein
MSEVLADADVGVLSGAASLDQLSSDDEFILEDHDPSDSVSYASQQSSSDQAFDIAVGRDLLVAEQVATDEVILQEAWTATQAELIDVEVEALQEELLPLDPLPRLLSKVISEHLDGMLTEAIHSGIKCTDCQAEPIKGVLFRCKDCRSSDYCRECEGRHHHPMYVIRSFDDAQLLAHRMHKSAVKPQEQGRRSGIEVQIAELRAMGFADNVKITKALIKSQFSINDAVNCLLLDA